MILEITSLNKIYHSKNKSFQALTDINIKIQRGEKIALLGLNGAGKSTLSGILAGTIIKTSGLVKINGFDIEEDRIKATKAMGIVHQEIIYDSFFTVKETLQIHSGYYGIKNNDKEISRMLEALDLYDKANIKTNLLSGGMKRRLMIAKALIHNPPLVILDEPTVGIDVNQRDKLWDYLDNLNKTRNVAILLTTHYMNEAELLCDKIIIINQGKIICEGSKHDIVNKFKIKHLLLELNYDNKEEFYKIEISKKLFQNNIDEFNFTFSRLDIYYSIDNEISTSEIFKIVESSGIKIQECKIIDADLELAFKRIIKS